MPATVGNNNEPTAQPAVQVPRLLASALTMQAVLGELWEAVADGVVLTTGTGTIALASQRLGGLFGYTPAELTGRPIEVLIPGPLRAAHRTRCDAYAKAPRTRELGNQRPLTGLRKDGTVIPVRICLRPVPGTNPQLILVVIRKFPPERLSERLTAREETVLRMLRGPLTLREIGRELHVSVNTIKTQTQAIYRKLGACSRPHAVRRGAELGIL